jgi:hypothetical protein
MCTLTVPGVRLEAGVMLGTAELGVEFFCTKIMLVPCGVRVMFMFMVEEPIGMLELLTPKVLPAGGGL